jgi:Type II secretion system (T2SS), protein M
VSSMSDRDRKILLLVLPLAVVVAYWFLLLSPKRDEATKADAELSQQQARLTSAEAAADQAKGAQGSFESDFTELVRLGKAIPSSVDMPSLIVQLDRAAAGTGIRFTRIATGDRQAAATPAATTGTTTGTTADGTTASGTAATGTSATPVAAGGETAQSNSGQAVESANNAAATSDKSTTATEQSGLDTQTSTSPSSGGLAVGGGSTAAAGTATTSTGTTTAAGLETVPLDLEFEGDFFNLADFFHDVKRFVSVANANVRVGGRLITVEGVRWSSDPLLFPKLKAEIKATIYLSPKTEGTTAGATPAGPATSTTTPASTPDAGQATPAPVPTATATP